MPKSLSSVPMFFEPRPTSTDPASWGFVTWMYRTSRAVHPRRNPTDLLRTTLLFVRQVRCRRQLRRWHRSTAAPLHEMLARRPALVSVVRRPYISGDWTADRRVAAIEDHYRQLAGVGRALRTGPESVLPLATIAGRTGTVEIVLDSPAWFIHEGELCLNLFQNGERLYTLAFSLGIDRGEPVAFVGAIQGQGKEGALDRYRALTSDFHGLRPRDLLIAAFRIVCREIGLVRWLGASDGARVGSSAYFGSATALRSSYDAVWTEHGGQLRSDGFFELPVHVARRSPGDIPARKRSSYRQRYEMLDRLDADLAQVLRARSQS